jgi:hypothetical protein
MMASKCSKELAGRSQTAQLLPLGPPSWAPRRTQDQAVCVVGEHQRRRDQQDHDKESVAKSEPETGCRTGWRLQVTKARLP